MRRVIPGHFEPVRSPSTPPDPRLGTTRWLLALSDAAIRNPTLALTAAALVTSIAAIGVGQLKLRTDGQALVSQSAPEVRYDQAIRRQFGIEDQIVVVVRSEDKDGIFKPDVIQTLKELTTGFRQIAGIEPGKVISLATEPSFRYRPGTYQVQRLLQPALTSKAGLDQLRNDLRRIELYTGTLVSSDGKSSVILIGIPPRADRSQLYQNVLNVIKNHKATGIKISVTGAPVAESLLGVEILQDLGVPKAFLGAGTRSLSAGLDSGQSHSPRELCLSLARHVGLVSIAAFAMMLVLWISFRSLAAALLPLPGVAAVLFFVFGLMGWCGSPIYLTIAVMPVLLTVISATNDIYLLKRYLTMLQVQPGTSHIELVQRTFSDLVRPVVCTSFACVIGFFSFGLSPLVPVRAFGVFTSIGAIYGLLFSLTVVPALFVLVPPRWLFPPRRRERPGQALRLSSGFVRWAMWVNRRQWWVVGMVLVGTALTPLCLRKLVVQDSWINGFDPKSEFRRVVEQVNRVYFGMHLLYVSVDAPRALTGELAATNVVPGTILLPASLVPDRALIEGSDVALSLPQDPLSGSVNTTSNEVWRARIYAAWPNGKDIFLRISPIDSFTNFWEAARRAGQVRYDIVLQSQLGPKFVRRLADLASFIRQRREDAVGGVLGPADYLLTTRFMGRVTDPEARRLAVSSAENKKLWNDYASAVGEARLRQVMGSNYWRSLTTVFLKDANFVDTARLMSAIRDYARTNLAPHGIHIGFAGDVAVSQALIHGIVTTQLQSLIWSLLGIFAVTAWFGGSWRWGFYCLLPSALAVLVKFAVMGWVGIPLGVATSMFAAMTLGIGVNCAIHLLEGYRQAAAAGASPSEAVTRSLSLTGPPALINTLAISLGFAVLMLSQVPANARLGLLLVLGLVNCFVCSMLILPVLLNWWPLKSPPSNNAPHRT